MLCWANEDSLIRQRNPNPQKAPETLKNLLLRSSVPLVSEIEEKLTHMAPLKDQESSKFHKHSFSENRKIHPLFAKESLLDKWPTADMEQYSGRKDHRNLMESYVSLSCSHK